MGCGIEWGFRLLLRSRGTRDTETRCRSQGWEKEAWECGFGWLERGLKRKNLGKGQVIV